MLQPYQQRVVDEKTALDEKLGSLGTFLSSRASLVNSDYELILMYRQAGAMAEYSRILDERIKAFTR